MAQLGITHPEEYSIGMIFDILTEQANDREKYIQLADQDDIDAFLGTGVPLGCRWCQAAGGLHLGGICSLGRRIPDRVSECHGRGSL